jgi:hypothetical protein
LLFFQEIIGSGHADSRRNPRFARTAAAREQQAAALLFAVFPRWVPNMERTRTNGHNCILFERVFCLWIA